MIDVERLFTIPFTLLYFVRKRVELRFGWIFLGFATFIVACGISHVMEIWTIWYPIRAQFHRAHLGTKVHRGNDPRIEFMAQIHEMLYQSADCARVPFAKYAKELAIGILRA